MGKVHGHFAFLVYVQFIFHFVLLALKCARLGAFSTVLAWLCLQVRSKRMQIHVLLFSCKDKPTMHFPHNMQQSIRYSYVQIWKPAVTSYSTGQHWDQYSRWRHETPLGQQTSYHGCMYSYACPMFSTLKFDFPRNDVKAVLRQKIKFIFLVEKTSREIC